MVGRQAGDDGRLDVVPVEAGATGIAIELIEDEAADRLAIEVRDNGRGMTPEQVERVLAEPSRSVPLNFDARN